MFSWGSPSSGWNINFRIFSSRWPVGIHINNSTEETKLFVYLMVGSLFKSQRETSNAISVEGRWKFLWGSLPLPFVQNCYTDSILWVLNILIPKFKFSRDFLAEMLVHCLLFCGRSRSRRPVWRGVDSPVYKVIRESTHSYPGFTPACNLSQAFSGKFIESVS